MARTRGFAMSRPYGARRVTARDKMNVHASVSGMRVDLLTREYPPHVYGGAGVHVTELARVLRRSIEVRVRCLDGPRDEPGVTGYSEPEGLMALHPVLGTFGADLQMAGDVGQDGGADLP